MFLILYLASFILLSYYSNKLEAYNAESASLTQEIESLRDTEAILLTQKDKLTTIEQIRSGQPSFTTILGDAENYMTDGISLLQLGIARDGTLKADLYASSSADLQRFVDNLVSNYDESSKYTSFKTSEIKLSKEGGYDLALQFQMKKDGNVK